MEKKIHSKEDEQMNKTYYEQIGTSEQLKTDMENEGFRYYKKASDGKHWLEAATKYDEEETLFHFLRMRKSSFISKTKKIADLFIDERKNP